MGTRCGAAPRHGHRVLLARRGPKSTPRAPPLPSSARSERRATVQGGGRGLAVEQSWSLPETYPFRFEWASHLSRRPAERGMVQKVRNVRDRLEVERRPLARSVYSTSEVAVRDLRADLPAPVPWRAAFEPVVSQTLDVRAGETFPRNPPSNETCLPGSARAHLRSTQPHTLMLPATTGYYPSVRCAKSDRVHFTRARLLAGQRLASARCWLRSASISSCITRSCTFRSFT